MNNIKLKKIVTNNDDCHQINYRTFAINLNLIGGFNINEFTYIYY